MSHNERVDKADKRFNKAVQVFNKLSNSLDLITNRKSESVHYLEWVEK
jgi:hypothetical protein